MTTDAGSGAQTLAITGLGAQGDGIAVGPDGELHVPQTLPGETVELVAGRPPVRVGAPSPDRRSTYLCPHFPACGGCAHQHMSDDLYRGWKEPLLAEALAQRGIVLATDPMLTVPVAARRRATFTGRWTEAEFQLGFHGSRSTHLQPITACAVLLPSIVKALPVLGQIASLLCRRDDEVRVHVLAADNGLDVVIDPGAKARSRIDCPALASLAAKARITRLTVDEEPAVQFAAPSIVIAGVALTPPPGAFLQAAAEADAILGRLVLAGLGKARRVADLFSGLGTLSLAIAPRARVLAADNDAGLLGALTAAHRLAHGLKPIETLRRDLFRDPLSPRELDVFDAVVLDPPRAGARDQAEALARSKVERVVMVSCNPATLARDLRILIDGGYTLERATPIDQFLYTAHLEAVAILRRRRAPVSER